MNLHASLTAARSITTPGATMRTLTSPSSTPDMPIAVWRTELPAGVSGPDHSIDGDQFVIVVSGGIDVRVDGIDHHVAEGDGIKLPGGVNRVIKASGDSPAVTITVGPAGARATVGSNDPVPIPWTA